MIARSLAVFLFAFASLTLPVHSPIAAAQTSTEKLEEEQKEADAVIQQKLRGVLGELDQYKNVFVTVVNGVVTLKGRVIEAEHIDQAAELASKIDGVASVKNNITLETSVEKRLTPALEKFRNRANQLLNTAPLAAISLIVFALIAFLGTLIARLKNPWDAITPNRFVANLLRQLVRLAFVVLGLVIALDIMGATALLGTIVGAAGILGLAIGFAVRDTVENYIASILLSFRQPFRPRDYVDIDGKEGFVMALTSRATVLMTADGNHLRIPNATVFKSIITNYSLNPERRFDFSLGVETDDLQRAVDIGLEEIRKLSFILDDPAPDGWLDEIGDSTMILWFGAWIDQNETSLKKARAEAIRKVKLAFEEAGIGLPEPIYRLRFDDALPQQGNQTSKPPAKRKKKVPPKEEAELDVSSDQTIEKKIDEELAKRDGNDLLDAEAPQELE